MLKYSLNFHKGILTYWITLEPFLSHHIRSKSILSCPSHPNPSCLAPSYPRAFCHTASHPSPSCPFHVACTVTSHHNTTSQVTSLLITSSKQLNNVFCVVPERRILSTNTPTLFQDSYQQDIISFLLFKYQSVFVIRLRNYNNKGKDMIRKETKFLTGACLFSLTISTLHKFSVQARPILRTFFSTRAQYLRRFWPPTWGIEERWSHQKMPSGRGINTL